MRRNRASYLTTFLTGLAVTVLCGGCSRESPSTSSPTAAVPQETPPPVAAEQESPAPPREVRQETPAPEAAPEAAAPVGSSPEGAHTRHEASKKPKHLASRGTTHVAEPAPSAEVPSAAPPPQPETSIDTVVVEARRAEQEGIPSRRVRLSDLNLASAMGACTALRRIRSAAGDVCPFDGEKELNLQEERQHCMDDSIARAVQATHSSRIQALHAGHSVGC
jgi:UrcA family protein